MASLKILISGPVFKHKNHVLGFAPFELELIRLDGHLPVKYN